jgi:hypothetical protein
MTKNTLNKDKSNENNTFNKVIIYDFFKKHEVWTIVKFKYIWYTIYDEHKYIEWETFPQVEVDYTNYEWEFSAIIESKVVEEWKIYLWFWWYTKVWFVRNFIKNNLLIIDINDEDEFFYEKDFNNEYILYIDLQ